MNHHINITRIKAIHNALRHLKDNIVFIGGAVVSLYAERDWDEVRETDDVDILVEVYTHSEYAAAEQQLRNVGFEIVPNNTFAGRYKLEGFIIDLMGLDDSVLGFSNRWYKEGFQNAIVKPLDERTHVKIFTGPYFLASKLEAFLNRGQANDGSYDGRTSNDFHDIVFVLTYRNNIYQEIIDLPEGALKNYLIEKCNWLLDRDSIEEWIDAHSSYHSPASYAIVLPGLREITGRQDEW